MWRCTVRGHHALALGQCYWEPLVLRPRAEKCRWYPVEEVSVFLKKAQQVRATFEAIQYLERGEGLPERIRRHLVHPRPRGLNTPDRQCFLVTSTVSHNLWGGSWLSFAWPPRADSAKLDIVTGTGFIHVVWMQIAQLLCGVRRFAQCDECGNLYPREGRRPKRGQRNFCPDCRMHYRTSKRLSAQRMRAARRET